MAGEIPSTITSADHYSILNPKSLILSQFSDAGNPNFFQLTTDKFFMERGPRYKAYSDLRESKLRSKSITNSPPLPPKLNPSATISTSPENQVKFPAVKRKAFSVLTQSVPDFSPVLRKENRKPALPPVAEKSATPPAKSSSRLFDMNSKLMGSKSSISREKRNGGMLTARRSCANMDELKKFSTEAANAINGETRRGRIAGSIAGNIAGNRGGGRATVLGSRQYY